MQIPHAPRTDRVSPSGAVNEIAASPLRELVELPIDRTEAPELRNDEQNRVAHALPGVAAHSDPRRLGCSISTIKRSDTPLVRA